MEKTTHVLQAADPSSCHSRKVMWETIPHHATFLPTGLSPGQHVQKVFQAKNILKQHLPASTHRDEQNLVSRTEERLCLSQQKGGPKSFLPKKKLPKSSGGLIDPKLRTRVNSMDAMLRSMKGVSKSSALIASQPATHRFRSTTNKRRKKRRSKKSAQGRLAAKDTRPKTEATAPTTLKSLLF